MFQLSHPYMTTVKTIALTLWIFFSKVMSLLFNMLSRFVIASLPRSKCFLNFMAAVTVFSDFLFKKRKSVIVSTFSSSIAMKCQRYSLNPRYERWAHYLGQGEGRRKAGGCFSMGGRSPAPELGSHAVQSPGWCPSML